MKARKSKPTSQHRLERIIPHPIPRRQAHRLMTQRPRTTKRHRSLVLMPTRSLSLMISNHPPPTRASLNHTKLRMKRKHQLMMRLRPTSRMMLATTKRGQLKIRLPMTSLWRKRLLLIPSSLKKKRARPKHRRALKKRLPKPGRNHQAPPPLFVLTTKLLPKARPRQRKKKRWTPARVKPLTNLERPRRPTARRPTKQPPRMMPVVRPTSRRKMQNIPLRTCQRSKRLLQLRRRKSSRPARRRLLPRRKLILRTRTRDIPRPTRNPRHRQTSQRRVLPTKRPKKRPPKPSRTTRAAPVTPPRRSRTPLVAPTLNLPRLLMRRRQAIIPLPRMNRLTRRLPKFLLLPTQLRPRKRKSPPRKRKSPQKSPLPRTRMIHRRKLVTPKRPTHLRMTVMLKWTTLRPWRPIRHLKKPIRPQTMPQPRYLPAQRRQTRQPPTH
mmetsp:Transcript_24622/g.57715  ORF Transcript_24622/g.57715 Transcript_24622/m.57715 type:complete len:437 (-) Transcript_24622:1169-2479(-)